MYDTSDDMITFTLMSKKEKQIWIDELRSGKHRKIKGCTAEHGGYCALGVLEYCVPNGKTLYDSTSYIDFLLKENPEVEVNLFDIIVKLNDDENKPFIEIADWIEINLPTKD